MNNDALRLAKAFKFAADRHVDQRRKGPNAEPYINHPADVAFVVAKHTGADDVDLVIACLLHDTVEDVGVTFEEIEAEFGLDVANIVREVTDDKTLPKETRKLLQIEHAPHSTSRAKKLKIGDKIVNLQSLLNAAPADWDNQRITEYFNWSKAVVKGCRGVNAGLELEFDTLYAEGARKFKFDSGAAS